MPSTLTLVGSPTIGSIDNAADWFWIWDTSTSSLKKVTVSTVFNNFSNVLVYANGISGGQSLSGGTAANDDLTLQGTTNATRTTSYVLLQPNGGNVGIGITSPAHALDIESSSTRLYASSTNVFQIVDSYNNTASQGPYIFTRRARGTFDSPISVQSGDTLGGFAISGTSTSGAAMLLSAQAAIIGYATENWNGAINRGTRIEFFVTPNGSSSISSAMIINNNGNVGIGTNAPAAMLEVEQSSATGAKPTLRLQQADVSEEFIRFDTTVGTGNPINDTILGAYYGRVRVFVEGVGAKWLPLYN